MQYLTLMNTVTKKSVPFSRNEFGEFIIMSSNPADDEDNIEVRLTNKFYEFSTDFGVFYQKTGIVG